MASDDNSGARPAGPVVLRIKLRYDDIDAMVQRFAPNVGKSGLFLPTKSIQPIGTEVKFELRLANDTPALVGIGKVKHIKPPDPKNPKAAFGMAIELMRVSREGREVIIRMIERRRAMGLADVAIPLPEDSEKANRNDVDTQPRAETSGIVKEAMAQFASAPVGEVVSLASGPVTVSGPIAVAKAATAPAKVEERPSAPLLTQARDSGPIKVVASLAPEPARAKRPRVADLIAKATELSGPLAAVPLPGLDEHVDVEAAMVRARALAAGVDLDAELANLREGAAAPIEISIEAASAELARQLGGTATAKRDKSQRWAPPPAVETKPSPPPIADPSASSEEFEHKTRAETEAGAAAVIAAVIDKAVEAAPPPDPAPIEEPQHVEAAPEVAPEPEPEPDFEPAPTATQPGPVTAAESQPGMMIDDNADSRAFERAYSEAERLHSGEYELLDDEYRGESTVIGAIPVDPNAFQGHAYATTPEAAAPEEQVSDVDVLAEADEQDADLLAAHGESDASREAPAYQDPSPAPDAYQVQPSYRESYQDVPVAQYPDEAAQFHAQAAAYQHERAASSSPVADQLSAVQLPEELPLPPSDDFDRSAADEFDRESAAEFDRELHRAPEPAQEQERPSVSDFAARLDLGDDDDVPPVADPPPPVVPAFAPRRTRRASSNNDFPDPPSSSYTFAEQFPQAALHPHESTLDRVLAEAGEAEDFDEPHSYGRAPSQPPQPVHYEPPTAPPPRRAQKATARPEDLEEALSALDVDLDDIAVEQEPPKRPSNTGQRPLPGLPIHRPTTGQTPIVSKPPTGQVPITPKPPTGPARTVAHTVKRQTGQRPTQPPPPPPQAFRKTPTQQVPITKPAPAPAAPKRAATNDDGVIIDFDDDE